LEQPPDHRLPSPWNSSTWSALHRRAGVLSQPLASSPRGPADDPPKWHGGAVAFDRADGVICVPLASTVNKPLQVQLLRRRRRHWHRSLALERPLSSPKGTAYPHNPDVDLQLADSIKFVFSSASISSARRYAAGHRTSDGMPIQRGRGRRSRTEPPGLGYRRGLISDSDDRSAVRRGDSGRELQSEL
jgi:hypothetical protein